MFESEADFIRADWPLLCGGAINLFWSPVVLARAQQALVALGYEVAEVSCGSQPPSFEVQISRALKWLEQFGYEPWSGNLNALNDALQHYPFGPSRRAALVFTGFHHLVGSDPNLARVILDIIECSARDHLLESKLLIALVQTDDPHFSCSDIGCRAAKWNDAELINTNRGL
ncbi:hypothetical protein [Sandaracinobacteroides saxicola]|uniref:Barstar (barnase inhibitor) domain-containing protein n=1 Tax=Sandaracinobacteroides saxicola TaxID=2759707 RepID=A0A7G5ILT2_9SPHN|nr:hypothetical protein [Sandaracinobacteroides saxicola]QMW24324.1 hypothetical protein H3309_07695 [Sandaracinobacteroides saxicola]